MWCANDLHHIMNWRVELKTEMWVMSFLFLLQFKGYESHFMDVTSQNFKKWSILSNVIQKLSFAKLYKSSSASHYIIQITPHPSRLMWCANNLHHIMNWQVEFKDVQVKDWRNVSDVISIFASIQMVQTSFYGCNITKH